MKKDKFIRYTTPKGIAQFPFLNEPDTQYNADGDYKVKVYFDDTPELQKLVESLKPILEEFVDEVSDSGKKVAGVKDILNDDGDGRLYMNFKQKAKIRTKDGKVYDMHVALFDKHAKPTNVAIGGNSVIRVSFTALPYYTAATKFCGLSLKPVAVQVIEAKQWTDPTDGRTFGFDAEEATTVDELEEDPPFSADF